MPQNATHGRLLDDFSGLNKWGGDAAAPSVAPTQALSSPSPPVDEVSGNDTTAREGRPPRMR